MALKKISFSQAFTRIKDEYGKTVNWTKEGQVIEGVYIDRKEDCGTNKSNVYMIENSEGSHAVWGSHQLDNLFTQVDLPSVVRITYLGKTRLKTGGKTVKNFDMLAAPLPVDFDLENDIYEVPEEEDNTNGN